MELKFRGVLAQIIVQENNFNGAYISEKILVCGPLPFTQETLKNIDCTCMNRDCNYYMQSKQSMFDSHGHIRSMKFRKIV